MPVTPELDAALSALGQGLTAHSALTAQWPNPLDEAARHGLAGDVVRAIEPHTEADAVAILVQFLVGVGNLIGRGPYFVAESDKHYPNLFCVLVGETSKARKGTSWGRVRELLQLVDREWTDNRIMGGLSSGEGLVHEVRDARLDAKGEVADEGVNDKRLLVVEPEFASVLKQASREKNILSTTIRQSWDTGHLRNMVVSRSARATDAHVSIVGHITRTELLRLVSETEAANGFGNRFLWLCVRRSRLLPDGGGRPDLTALSRRLRDVVQHARTVGELRRDDQARACWHELYGPLSEGKPGLLGAMLARAEAQVMRLAVLYALLDLSRVVGEDHLRAALAVWDYADESARYIFGDALGDPTADTILESLRGQPGGLTREQIRSDVFGRHKPAAEIARALTALRDQQLANVSTVETGGRPAEVWRATGWAT